ncbi:hypothetical protein ACLKA7_001210 [Drosophila subpalustris]
MASPASPSPGSPGTPGATASPAATAKPKWQLTPANRIVVKGLHYSTEIDEIKEALAVHGHVVRGREIKNAISRTTKKPMSLFFVNLEPASSNKDVFAINRLCQLLVNTPASTNSARGRLFRRNTNVERYQQWLQNNLDATVEIETGDDLDNVVEHLNIQIHNAASHATPPNRPSNRIPHSDVHL